MQPTRTPKLAPYLSVGDARGLAAFIEQGIGGRLSYEESDGEGHLVHGELRVADGVVMVGEAPSGRPNFSGMIHLYVSDADAAFRRALEAGAEPVQAPTTRPDGDRRGGVKDRWGNQWWFTRAPGPG